MRDDIFKGAPVSKAWKLVVKDCLTEATSQTAAERAERALVSDIAGNLSSALHRALTALAKESPQLSLGDSGTAVEGFRRLAQSKLDDFIVSNLKVALKDGTSRAEAVEYAFREGIRAWSDSQRLNTSYYLHAEAPKEAGQVVMRLSNAVAALPCREMARTLTSGGKISQKQLTRKSPEKVMDLALPKKKPKKVT